MRGCLGLRRFCSRWTIWKEQPAENRNAHNFSFTLTYFFLTWLGESLTFVSSMIFSVWGSETHTSLHGGRKSAAILPAHTNTFLILPLSAALMRDRSCVAAEGGAKHISGAWITAGVCVCVCVTACPLLKRAVFLTAAVSSGTGLRGFHCSPGEQKLSQVSTLRKQLNPGVSFVERMKMDVCKPDAEQ